MEESLSSTAEETNGKFYFNSCLVIYYYTENKSHENWEFF